MAMGRSQQQPQQSLWIGAGDLPRSSGHPFYRKLNEILAENEFDVFVEDRCKKFYAKVMGRPSIAPGMYFRLLLIGFFEGIDSERGIAWRASDSLALREFLGLELQDDPPDHSTISRTRRRIDLQTHNEVFTWVLTLLAKGELLRAKTFGIDGTTLEANAALRSIVRRDTGEGYEEFLTGLATSSGIETPTRADLSKIDKKRPKKGSNKEWVHPDDPEAKITKMKDGRTHLAHKAEHAVDMETGAVIAVTLHGGTESDTKTIGKTEEQARSVIADVMEDPEAAVQLSDKALSEVVGDKGYHSNEVLKEHHAAGVRTYISEPDRGQRNWQGKPEEKEATYANRRRIRGARGRALLRRRGEILERSFAHCYETGGMRRLHLRGHENALKRVLVHVAAFNLSLLMRKLYSVGKPRVLQGLSGLVSGLSALLRTLGERSNGLLGSRNAESESSRVVKDLCIHVFAYVYICWPRSGKPTFATGC